MNPVHVSERTALGTRPARIALVQPDFKSAWTEASIGPYLAAAADLGAELAVFPEIFPFWSVSSIPSLDEARARLAALPCPDSLAFIAGGLIWEGAALRNAAFLTYRGAACGTYFKQILWRTELVENAPFPVVPGERATRFTWADRACVPLICADVFSPSLARRQQLFAAVRAQGALDGDLFVVCAYAGGPRSRQWRASLSAWAQEFDSPVAFCSFAGEDIETDPGTLLGGGGSAVFRPDARRAPPQPTAPGIYIHDL